MKLFFQLVFAYTVVCKNYSTEFNNDIFPRIVHLDVKTLKSNGTYIYNFNCTSSRESIGNSAEFTIDTKTVEHLTYVEGKCINSKAQECVFDNCQCFPIKNSFMFYYKDNFPDPERVFGCQMRFINLQTNEILNAYISVKINGTDVQRYEFDAKIISNQKLKYNNESKDTITNKYSVNIVVLVPVGFCVILVVLIVSAVCKWCIQRGKKKKNRKEVEEISLLTLPENAYDQSRCALCYSISRHVFCVNCKQFYCVFCSHYHARLNHYHIIMPLSEVGMKRSIQHCKKCTTRKAKRLCAKCKEIFCNNRKCDCVHSQNLFDMLSVDLGFYAPVSIKLNANPVHVHVDMPVINTIKLSSEDKQIRICGISLHFDDKCTTVDSNNKNVTVFKGSEKICSSSLKNEPKGMAKVDDSKIAITFPQEMRIILYRIYENTIIETQTIDTSQHGKPFSICYDASHFAIEIGEGEDGRVVILDYQGELKYEIQISANIAPFTGNSIKLSLDMDKRRIFVSAIEKQVISCVNLQGNILWSMGFPSTGDLVFIKEREFFSEYILLSSEKDNTVYHVSADDGSSRRFFFYKQKQNRCPQHIAYFNHLLAILVDDTCINILKDDPQPSKYKVGKIRKVLYLHFHLNSPSPLFEP